MAFQKLPQVNAGSVAASLGALNQSLANIQKGNEVTPDLLEQFATKRRASDLEAAQEALRLGNEIPTDSLFGIDQSALTKYSQNLAAEDRAAAADAFTRSLDPFKRSQEQYKSETAKEKLDIMGLEEKRAQAAHDLKISRDTIARDKAQAELNQYDEELKAKLGNLRARTAGTQASTKGTDATTASTEESTKTKIATNTAAERLLTEEASTSEGLTDLGDRYDFAGNLNPNYLSEFNTLYRDLAINSNNKNAATRLKPIANEMAEAAGNAGSAITEASIQRQITNPNDNTAYTEALFNQIVNEEFKRLRKDNLYADPTVLRKAAIASIDRTSAGSKFREQKWYERQTRPEKWKLDEQLRLKNIKTDFRTKTQEVVTAYDTFTKEKSDINRTAFRTKLAELSRQYEEDPTGHGPNTLKTINKWTNRALTDYTQNTFNPEESYISRFQKSAQTQDGKVVKLPLELDEYSPTNQRTFIAEETAKLKAEFPYADDVVIQKKIAARLANSGLAVKFAQGALPAKLKSAAAKYRFEEEVDRIDRRSKRIKSMADDNGLQNHVYKNLTQRWIGEGETLDQTQASKLRKELTDTIGIWKGYIPNWKKLHRESKKTYEIAMAEVLSQAQIDKDLNFLWLDPNDYSIAAHGSSTSDMSGIKKNAALTALMQHISPYGVNQGGASNRTLIDDLSKAVLAFNEKVAKQTKKSVDKLSDSPI